MKSLSVLVIALALICVSLFLVLYVKVSSFIRKSKEEQKDSSSSISLETLVQRKYKRPKSLVFRLPYGLWFRLLYGNTFLLTIQQNSSSIVADTLKDKFLKRVATLPIMLKVTPRLQNWLQKRII